MVTIATYKSMSSLKRAIQKEVNAAFNEVVDDSFNDLQENVDYFYSAPEGEYHRTGQLRASPQVDAVNINGNSAKAQISINTSTQYYPAGRDTATIYGYAEDDGLRGKGGFWRETLVEIDENIKRSFGSRFK